MRLIWMLLRPTVSFRPTGFGAPKQRSRPPVPTTHDFGATFVLDQLDGLSEFEHSGLDDPERMFHDGALDAARERFLAAVKCFLQLVSSNTGPVGATLRRQGVAEAHILDSVRVIDSDVNRQFVTEIDELNEAADLVGIRHSELLTLGRQRLRT